MDPFAAIGVASAVITFIEFGAAIVKRLEELSQVGDLPKAFREIRTRLPLILGIVTRTQEIHESLKPWNLGKFATIKESTDVATRPWATKYELNAVVEDCFSQVKLLEEILQKLSVAQGDSKWKKSLRAVASLVEEPRVQRIASNLSASVQLLVALNTIHVEKRPPLEKQRRATEAPPAYAKTFGVFLLPFERDANFIGRDETMAEIESSISKNQRVSIAGMGGVGKSQVAIEYAYRFKDARPNAHVFWVYGGTIARFYQGYKKIAQNLNLPMWDDPDVSILELVSTWLRETPDEFLLIVDNADNIDHFWPNKYKPLSVLDKLETNLSTFLPNSEESKGKLLLTTRDKRVATKISRRNEPIILKPMSVDEGRSLFLSRVENDISEAEDGSLTSLVQTLDCLPLAITQAASFIDENAITITEYMATLDSDEAEEFLREELDDFRRDEESANSIFRTWKVSFDTISKQKPMAADLLSLLAVLDRQSIPRWLVKMPEAVTSIGLLSAFHMITLRAGANSVQLHRLIQRFVQSSLKHAGTLQKWQNMALSCLADTYPTEIGVNEHAVCDVLAPHVQTITKYNFESKESRLKLAHLLCWAADFDIERGMYVQALDRAKQSFNIFSELVAPDDERLVSSTWLYGRLLYYEAKSIGDLDVAASILQRAFSSAKPASLNYAESAFELAHLYFVQGKENECLKMGKASFECWKEMEGDLSVRTLDNKHDYALELAMFKHEEEAIQNWQSILDFCPKSEASDDTKTVFTYRSLASIAEFQGDSGLAEMLYSKLIELCSKIYNSEHIHVWDYRLSHAEMILRQERPDEAMELGRSMLQTCQNKSEWRIMLSCHELMAECSRMNGTYTDEKIHRLKCLELQTRFLGENHKETVSAANAAAICFLNGPEPAQADELFQRVTDWRETNLGAEDPRTLDSLEFLGVCKVLQELDNQAEQLFEIAVARNRVQNSRWARALDNLCTALWNQGKWTEVENRCRQLQGTENEYTLGAHWMLVTALEKQGMLAEALALRAQSLEIEDEGHGRSDVRRAPRQPVVVPLEERRFGRIVHPRTWSS